MKAFIGYTLIIIGSAAGMLVAFFLWEAFTTKHLLRFPVAGVFGLCLVIYGYSLAYENQPNNNHRS
jgi:hypothetical protein